MNAFDYRDCKLFCEGVPADELVAQFGTPLYVYSRREIVTRFREFRSAFAELDPLIAFSVKSNGNLSVLRLLAEEGAGADIVSGGELYRARLAGIRPERIVFSGVGKTVTELAAALEAGIYGFNVESAGELRELEGLGEAMGIPAPIALRVNPDVESPTPHAYTRTGHRETKFGIPIEEALRLYRAAARTAGLRVRGIDVHIGSQILEVEPYVLAVQRVLEVVDELRRDGIELEYIDVGGGFGIPYEGGQGMPAAEFGKALVPLLRDSGLRAVFEPGRYVVGPAGVLLTRVLYIKDMGEKTFVITDAGMNDLLRPSHYASYHHVAPAEQHPERDTITVDVVGPICESGDFLALDRPVERPREGELLVIGEAGAYGFAMASTYNARTRPAEVLVDGERSRLIRRRETYEDLVRGEVECL
ncbi:MAG TPA: diaminopimelate decarboxylase [Longimicrobiales bacterium]|nr:diaminopimelate decarboxylase [Longimicrobiales bacterium]